LFFFKLTSAFIFVAATKRVIITAKRFVATFFCC